MVSDPNRKTCSEWERSWKRLRERLEDAYRSAAGWAQCYLRAVGAERSAASLSGSVGGEKAAHVARAMIAKARREKHRAEAGFRKCVGQAKERIAEAERFAEAVDNAGEVAVQQAGGPLFRQDSGYAGIVQTARSSWTEESSFFTTLSREVWAAIERARSELRSAHESLGKTRHDDPSVLSVLGTPKQERGAGRGSKKADRRPTEPVPAWLHSNRRDSPELSGNGSGGQGNSSRSKSLGLIPTLEGRKRR